MAKDIPLSEITLRRYEKPENLDKRELVRKICLSLGLLQPGDSRDVVVDILHVLILRGIENSWINSEDIRKNVISEREKRNMQLVGIAPSNIRRQIRRLRNLFLVEKKDNKYRIHEFEKVNKLYEDRIKKFYLGNIMERVDEYFDEIAKIYEK